MDQRRYTVLWNVGAPRCSRDLDQDLHTLDLRRYGGLLAPVLLCCVIFAHVCIFFNLPYFNSNHGQMLVLVQVLQGDLLSDDGKKNILC